MKHTLSSEDREFHRRFIAHAIEPARFHHHEHLRLAYIFLIECGRMHAYPAFRTSLQSFLQYHEIDPAKYHETLTQAWMLAVWHFMEMSAPKASAEEFIRANAALLDPKIMLTHYSQEVMASAHARTHFVEPDIQPIPRHGAA